VLGSVKCPLAVKPLAEVLNSDTSPEVRKEAALALAMSGDQRALKFLKEALPRERRNDVKEIIEKSIEKLQSSLPEVMEGN
jgi:HEAT repeat protein